MTAPTGAPVDDAAGDLPARPPDLLIAGPVTWDEFEDGSRRPGGAVTYAARTAEALGVRAAILVLGGDDLDLAALAAHDVVRVNAPTLIFRHQPRGQSRHLRVLTRPGRGLSAADLPPAWGAARVRILAPLVPDDIALTSFAALPPQPTALLGQGLLRLSNSRGDISVAKRPLSLNSSVLSPYYSLFLSDEETRPWPVADFEAVLARVERLVVTRGGEGASIYHRESPSMPIEVPAVPAEPHDTTGAGDVFATAFILALSLGLADSELAAAQLASGYAAAAAERIGPVPLPPRADIEARIASLDGSKDRLS